jgi:aspartate 1-decarboxylase
VLRTLLSGKIHRARVTQADLHYVGSLTVDEDLLDAAGIAENELVQVVDIDTGARLTTYAIRGPRGSGVIGANGAAARLIHPGDLVIIMSFGIVDSSAVTDHRPRVVHVDADNRIVALGDDSAEPVPGMPGQLSGAIAV